MGRWLLSTATRKPERWLATRYQERWPRLSPDGRWVAYTSDETGRQEVYVRPLRGSGVKYSVSRDGGSAPVWSRSGGELFFLQRTALMAARVTSGATFEVARPVRLFQLRRPAIAASDPYDVTRDGKRFVVIESLLPKTPTHANLVIGWFEEIRARMNAAP